MDPFHTTVWSRIEEARRGDDSAVWAFVERYRPALLRLLHQQGVPTQDAEDLAQEILLRLFSKDALARADREVGRFRAFLVGIAKNVILEHRRRRGAQKRGGGATPVALSEVPEPQVEQAEQAFDRIWAEQLLLRAFQALKVEHATQYEALVLRFQESLSLADVAERTGRTVTQVRNDVHRGRKRLARIVRDDVMRYASSREEFAEELALFGALVGMEL